MRDAGPDDAWAGDAGADAATTPAKRYGLGKSTGCGNATGTKGLKTLTKSIGGKSRTALRFVPDGYNPSKAVALIFGFHGMGLKSTSATSRAQLALEAEAGAQAIFIYPQALPDPAYENKNRWQHRMKDSVDHQLVDALMVDAIKEYCIDLDRVFAVGFSNGAEMAAMLGCFKGDKFRAIAPIAPGGGPENVPLAGCVGEVSIWVGVGDDDASHQNASKLVRDFYRTANGCTATLTPTTPKGCGAYGSCREKVPSTWCTYAGDHTVPSFAGEAIWSFLSKLK